VHPLLLLLRLRLSDVDGMRQLTLDVYYDIVDLAAECDVMQLSVGVALSISSACLDDVVLL
jgi:hypothetical protein